MAGRSFFELHSKAEKSRDFSQLVQAVAKTTHSYHKTVKELPDLLANERAQMRSHWQSQYATWRLQLRAGFNLLFYGYGSKRAELTAFAEEALTDGGFVAVSGWRAGVTAKAVLFAAASALLHNPTRHFKGMSASAVLDLVRRAPEHRRVYVVIHNIDGPGLRAATEQSLLSQLAACECVHLVASVDHANAAAICDKRQARAFAWLWHPLPTFSPLLAETLGVGPILAACKQQQTQEAAHVVLTTLSDGSRAVFRTLAEALLEDQLDEEDELEGVSYERLFRLCRERFLVSSDVTLKTHLTEFRDHELVRTRRGPDGAELLVIPLPAPRLRQVLAELDGGSA